MNRRELKSKLDVAESRLEWLMSNRPRIQGGRQHIIKRNEIWTVGVTEREDGSFSSVWMAVTGD